MDSSVFVYDPTADDDRSRVRGIGRYLQILRQNFDAEWQFIPRFEPYSLKREGVVFINPFFNFLAPPLSLGKIASKQIAVIHDLIPLKYPEHFPLGLKGNFNVFLNTQALKNYDIIVAVSETVKKDVVNMLHIPESRVKVIYHTLPQLFLKANKVDTKEDSALPPKYCLYVGDATWNKNLVTLAKAIKEINVTCLFVGKVFENNDRSLSPNLSHPWQQELREFLKVTEGDKRFVFKGFVEDEKLIQLYKRSVLNIAPSRDEGFGFSYLEAASQGTPSVLSDIEVFHEVSDDKGAIFARPDDPNAFANAVGEVYFRKGKRDEFGFGAFQRSKFFSAQNFKESWNSICT